MKLLKDYLTSEELIFIVNSILEADTAIERYIIKIGVMSQLLFEGLDDCENCNEVYDRVVKDGGIELLKTVAGYQEIDNIIAQEESVSRTVKESFTALEKNMDADVLAKGLQTALVSLKDAQESYQETLLSEG